MKKRYMIPLSIIIMLVVVYWVGPRLPRTELDVILPVIPAEVGNIERYVHEQEVALPVKPDNEGIILWGDSVGQPTTFVLLYLHGFSASRHEG